jgi:hypothetical protein
MDKNFEPDELLFIYNTLEKAILKDDYDLTCQHCVMRRMGNCRNEYCDFIKTKLNRLIESK